MKTRVTLIICMVWALVSLTACSQKTATPDKADSSSVNTTSQENTTVASTESEEYDETGSESDTSSTGLMGSFSAKDLDGNDIDQNIFAKYDLTMVNVWATYCGPCLSEMPELGELAKEYESKGVRIVGMISDVLNSDGTVSESQLDTARSIVSNTGADYLHIVPSEDLFGLLSQITAVPTTFFVDANGAQVGSAYLGSKSKAEWTALIEEMLKEPLK